MTNKKILLTFTAITIVVIAWYALSPLLRNTELQEMSPLNSTVDTVATSTEANLVAEGDFVASAHDVKGRALLIKGSNSTTLRFEDFETINGPDVRIYLSKDLTDADYIELGNLKATKGNVNYDVPENTDTSVYNKVLIWCEDFSVLFSYAELL